MAAHRRIASARQPPTEGPCLDNVKSVVRIPTYHYLLSAEDYSHNTSYSEPFSISIIEDGIRPSYPVENAVLDTVRHQVVINWKRPLRSKEKFILYKSIHGGTYSRAATIDLIDGQYVDKDIPIDFDVKYKVKTLYSDGTYSKARDIEVVIKR